MIKILAEYFTIKRRKCFIIICHNGKVFTYTSEEEIRESLFDLMIAEYYDAHYNENIESEQTFEFEAQLSVLKEIKESYDIDFKEVVSHG